VKLFLATKMKCAVVSALISLAFVSQASAVLRPLFPAKPVPPFNGEVIIIGGDFGDSNPDCSPVGINRRDAAAVLSRVAEIFDDDFPMYRRRRVPMLLF